MELMEQIQKQLSDISNDVKDIKISVSGNPLDRKDNGLIGHIKDHHIRIAALERIKTKSHGLVIGLSIGAGWGFSDIIVKLFAGK